MFPGSPWLRVHPLRVHPPRVHPLRVYLLHPPPPLPGSASARMPSFSLSLSSPPLLSLSYHQSQEIRAELGVISVSLSHWEA